MAKLVFKSWNTNILGASIYTSHHLGLRLVRLRQFGQNPRPKSIRGSWGAFEVLGSTLEFMGDFIAVVPGLGCYGVMGDSTDQRAIHTKL